MLIDGKSGGNNQMIFRCVVEGQGGRSEGNDLCDGDLIAD